MRRYGEGVTVNDILKIHCSDPTINDHYISLKIQILEYNYNKRVYSHILTPSKALASELYSNNKLCITPDRSEWSPYCLSY